jgi:hypothetical protein
MALSLPRTAPLPRAESPGSRGVERKKTTKSMQQLAVTAPDTHIHTHTPRVYMKRERESKSGDTIYSDVRPWIGIIMIYSWQRQSQRECGF